MTTLARAILLLPAGFRVYDEDFTVECPPPKRFRLPDGGTFGLVHLHHGGDVDDETRALYVLGGAYLPHGATHEHRHDPDEAHDQ